MGNKVTTLYDFTLTANGSQEILADADFYKVLTSSGDLSITRDGGSTIKPLRAGRGERNVPFLRLMVRDLSGAPNSGTILVGDSDFIDDTIVLSNAINVRPEVASGSYSSSSNLVANTPDAVFTAAANANGALILTATTTNDSTSGFCGVTLISKATSLPATIHDGQTYLREKSQSQGSSWQSYSADLPKEQYVPAGHGLYWISTLNTTVNSRACRYKLL